MYLFGDAFTQVLEALADVWWVVVGFVGEGAGDCEELLVRSLQGVDTDF